MKIYNTLTRRKEQFVPLDGGNVKMYACGITVSGEAHIGHGYQALIYDIMRKFLEKQGYNVTYARNYTDVDDKIIAKSRETGIPADKYAADMIKHIDDVMRKFDVDDPTLWLKATENIGNIIKFIKTLIEKVTPTPRITATCISMFQASNATAAFRTARWRTCLTACAWKTGNKRKIPRISRCGSPPNPTKSAGIPPGARADRAGI